MNDIINADSTNQTGTQTTKEATMQQPTPVLDINALFSAAVLNAVNAATAPLVERIAALEARLETITTASDELTGIWKPSDIRYNGTYFEIKKKAITFRTKDGDSNSYTIIKIKRQLLKDKDWVRYTIFYRDLDSQKVEFPFYFRSADRGVIRFKNQPSLVWKKDVEMTS